MQGCLVLSEMVVAAIVDDGVKPWFKGKACFIRMRLGEEAQENLLRYVVCMVLVI